MWPNKFATNSSSILKLHTTSFPFLLVFLIQFIRCSIGKHNCATIFVFQNKSNAHCGHSMQSSKLFGESPKTLEFKSSELEMNKSFPLLTTTANKQSFFDEKEVQWKASKALAPLPIPIGPRADGVKLHIRQPFKILTDIWGVLTSHNFRTELFAHLETAQARFLTEHIDDTLVKPLVASLIRRTKQDIVTYTDMPAIDETLPKEALVQAVSANLSYRRAHSDRKLMSGLDSINNQIWNEGYASKRLRPHLFPDVLPNFQRWTADPFYIKIYTFASGPPEIQKLFLSACIEGDPGQYTVWGFDAYHRYKYDPSKYRGVLASLDERDPRNLFYLTDSPKKAKAARTAGMTAFVVRRQGNRDYRPEALAAFPLVASFDEFDFFEFGGGCC